MAGPGAGPAYFWVGAPAATLLVLLLNGWGAAAKENKEEASTDLARQVVRRTGQPGKEWVGGVACCQMCGCI